MSQTPIVTTSSSNYQTIFDNAIEAYKKKTKKDLRSHPLLGKLQNCGSPDTVLRVLYEQIPGFDQSRDTDDQLTKWLNPTVNVLYTFSGVIGGGISLVSQPAGVIFTGIGVLLSTAKAVSDGQDGLATVFERVETFFRRLETYVEVRPTVEMTDIIVKIMVEVLFILSFATKELKQSRARKYLKKLVGRTEVADALGRLDRLTQDEVRIAAAEGLKATHGVENKVQAIGDKVQAAQDTVQGVDDKVQGVDDKMRDVDNKVNLVIDGGEKIREELQRVADGMDDHKRTALWSTEGDAFNAWKASGSSLWIHGKPGSGKSVLSAVPWICEECTSAKGSTVRFNSHKDLMRHRATSKAHSPRIVSRCSCGTCVTRKDAIRLHRRWCDGHTLQLATA